MVLAIAIPLAPILVQWLIGVAAVLTLQILLDQSNLGSKVKQYISQAAEKVKEDLERKEPRESTPFTHPILFKVVNLPKVKTKAHEKIALNPKDTHPWPCPVGSIWCEDWLHCWEFEVYADKKTFEKNIKHRVVFIDGRTRK